MKTLKQIREALALQEIKTPYAVVDTADGNKVVALSSDERDAKRSIHNAERPPMSIKNKSTLKIVKTRKKQEVGYSLKEATGDKEAYQKFFKGMLKKFGVTEPDQLKGDDKKKFYDAIDAGWEADNETD